MNQKYMTAILVAACVMLISSACSGKKNRIPFLEPEQPKPGSAEHLSSEGMTLLGSGNIAEARSRFQAALAKAPNHIDAILGMGLIHLSSQEFEQSLNCFVQLKKLTPESYDVHNYLGVIYLELKQYDKAREHLLLAATSEKYETPENAYANLATLELRQNNPQAALRYVSKGLEKKKNFALLHSIEGQIYEGQSMWREALLAYERASTILYNADPLILSQMARMQARMGNRHKALDILESSLGKARSENERQIILQLIEELNRGR